MWLLFSYKMKKQKYHPVGMIPKSKFKIVRSNKIDTPNTQVHDRSLSWLGTAVFIQIKVAESNQFYDP
jgi:hypothetical protein